MYFNGLCYNYVRYLYVSINACNFVNFAQINIKFWTQIFETFYFVKLKKSNFLNFTTKKFRIKIHSEPIWVNPKKIFNLVYCKSVENLSDLIRVNPRLWIWMIPDNFGILMNPRSKLFGLIRIENSVQIILTSDSFGLRTSFGLIRIGSLGLSRIKSDWTYVRIKNFGLTRIETDWFSTDLHRTRD